MNFKNVILASASPRRSELLGLIFSDFSIIPSNVEEIVPKSLSAEEGPEYLALLKARDIAENNPEALVIGADTSVIIEGRVLGKPKTGEEAFSMLKMLSGRTHKVITGCAVVSGERYLSFSTTTLVKFFPLSDGAINEYIASKDPFDKAGSYGIQSKGALFVEEIKGDYFNVVGLPVASLKRELDKF